MYEAQGTGMQRLTRAYLKTVGYKFLIRAGAFTSQYFIAPVTGVVEKRMAYMLHMYTYLMCTPRFKTATHHAHISELFNRFIMCDSMFSQLRVADNSHLQPVFRIAPYQTLNTS